MFVVLLLLVIGINECALPPFIGPQCPVFAACGSFQIDLCQHVGCASAVNFCNCCLNNPLLCPLGTTCQGNSANCTFIFSTNQCITFVCDNATKQCVDGANITCPGNATCIDPQGCVFAPPPPNTPTPTTSPQSEDWRNLLIFIGIFIIILLLVVILIYCLVSSSSSSRRRSLA
jgi:hypothetical protein